MHFSLRTSAFKYRVKINEKAEVEAAAARTEKPFVSPLTPP
jgi:hypothetical protein